MLGNEIAWDRQRLPHVVQPTTQSSYRATTGLLSIHSKTFLPQFMHMPHETHVSGSIVGPQLTWLRGRAASQGTVHLLVRSFTNLVTFGQLAMYVAKKEGQLLMSRSKSRGKRAGGFVHTGEEPAVRRDPEPVKDVGTSFFVFDEPGVLEY